MPDQAPTTATKASPARLRSLLVLLCAALAAVLAANAALSIAIPDLAIETGADQSQLTWIIDAYALAFAALLLPAGIAADRIGRRTVLVTGLLIFAAASLISAFSTDPSVLIALRALAGVGAACVFPVTLSALVDAYPEERRAFAVAVWSGISAAGAVLGSLMAGVLLEFFWWGSVQVVFGVVALILVPGVAIFVAQHRDRSLSLDPLGALLSAVALTGLVYGVIEAPTDGWTSAKVLTAFGVGLVAGAGFIVHQLRSPVPSLDVRLFGRRGLAAGSLLVSLQFFASLGLFVLGPQYLQLVLGYSPLQAALAFLVIPVGVGAGTGLTAGLIPRVGARLPGAGGLLVMAGGFVALAIGASATAPSLWALVPGLLVFGLGFGLAVTPGTVLILNGLPADRRSVASAVNDITREVGGVVGIAVLSSVLISTYRSDIAPTLASVPDALREPASDGAGTAIGIADRLGSAGGPLADAARSAFATGFCTALWVTAAVLVVAAGVCALLAPGRRAADSPPETALCRDRSGAQPEGDRMTRKPRLTSLTPAGIALYAEPANRRTSGITSRISTRADWAASRAFRNRGCHGQRPDRPRGQSVRHRSRGDR